MSREERRNYERMKRTMERGPALPPAAKARAERVARRRAAAPPRRRWTYWTRATIAAVLLGLLAFSIAWPNGMPAALYIGLGVALVVLVAAFVLHSLRARTARSEAPRP